MLHNCTVLVEHLQHFFTVSAPQKTQHFHISLISDQISDYVLTRKERKWMCFQILSAHSSSPPYWWRPSYLTHYIFQVSWMKLSHFLCKIVTFMWNVSTPIDILYFWKMNSNQLKNHLNLYPFPKIAPHTRWIHI